MSFLECECGARIRSHVKIGQKLVQTTVCPHCGKALSTRDHSPEQTDSDADQLDEPRGNQDRFELISVELDSSLSEPSVNLRLQPIAARGGSISGDERTSAESVNPPPKWQRLSTAYGSSLMLHLIVGSILAVLVIPTVFRPWQEQLVVELAFPESTVVPDVFEDHLAAAANGAAPGIDPNPGGPEAPDAGIPGMALPIAVVSDSSVSGSAPNVGLTEIKTRFDDATSKDARNSSKNKAAGKRPPVSKFLRTAMRDGSGFNNPLLKSAKEGLIVANSPAAASQGVFSQLAGEGAGGGENGAGNRWHIWLLDASISLQAERQKLAEDVAEFYRAASQKDRTGHLDVSVVAFGQRSQSIIEKTRVLRAEAGKLIGSRIKDLPLDETGIENVMTAVSDSIKLVPPNFPTKISIVIWTDESGDDIELLEETIAECHKLNASVHIVGPRSVFGMQPGLQRHTLAPPLSWELVLPVTRGPDSAFPERLRLPLWYDSTDMPWSSGIPIASSIDAQSLGGPLRCGLLAPTGPYALTRLALATGGTYTILDRHGDAPPPNAGDLLKYTPDYRGAREIAADLEKHPLRRAVVESAAMTWMQDFWPPQREFPVSRSEHYPFIAYNVYVTPFQFVQNMSLRLQQDRARLADAAVTLEQALELLDSVPAAREKDSPRWNAWYTLNRGLLLAHSIRIREFLNVTEPLLTGEAQLQLVNNEINHLLLTESEQLTAQGPAIRRAKLARSLLEQVIREHPNTPWSQLAKWELQHQLGFNIVYRQIPIPQNITIPPPAPHPTLPRL